VQKGPGRGHSSAGTGAARVAAMTFTRQAEQLGVDVAPPVDDVLLTWFTFKKVRIEEGDG
jgi:hypothetical protein